MDLTLLVIGYADPSVGVGSGCLPFLTVAP